MEKFNQIISFLINKNLLSLLVFIAVTAGLVYGEEFLRPKIISVIDLYKQNQQDAEKLVQLENELAEQKRKKEVKVEVQKVPVIIYKAKNPQYPLETTAIDFVSSVINKLERTQNSIIDISYKTDNTAAGSLPSNVAAVQLVMTLNGTYTSFQDFIFELYDDEYLATIKSLRMVPLIENKNMLEINVVILLYITK